MNVISVIAMAGVAVATMAIVVVLSVFNGFSELSRKHLSLIDPDLKVVPAQGKVFEADSLCQAIAAMPGVEVAMPSLQERALAVSGNRQMPVVVRGVVPELYGSVVPFDCTVIDGVFNPDYLTDAPAAVLSVGTAMQLAVRPGLEQGTTLYVPHRRGRINPANPAAAYRSASVTVSGVFAVDQPEYDADYIVTDISLLRHLLDYGSGEASAIEVRTAPGADAEAVAATIAALAGDGYEVLTRQRQQADTFKMISVEKWVTFLMLVFILLVACFNIVTTLSLMVIEKRSDMATLRALGATHGTVTGIFVWEGTLITCAGGVAGIALGVLLSWLQQTFGLIKLSADPSALSIDVYPVHIEGTDVAIIALTVLATSVLLGQVARLFTRR